MLLQLCGLTVALQNETILSDLSLSVQKGEFLALLGPSGCGKSTLLKSIAGIVPLQQGQVILDGQDITRTPVHKRGTVILFQEMRLFPNMTVLENVAFPLKMQGIGKTQRLKQAEAFLQQEPLLKSVPSPPASDCCPRAGPAAMPAPEGTSPKAPRKEPILLPGVSKARPVFHQSAKKPF